jgi:hypothetical protein
MTGRVIILLTLIFNPFFSHAQNTQAGVAGYAPGYSAAGEIQGIKFDSLDKAHGFTVHSPDTVRAVKKMFKRWRTRGVIAIVGSMAVATVILATPNGSSTVSTAPGPAGPQITSVSEPDPPNYPLLGLSCLCIFRGIYICAHYNQVHLERLLKYYELGNPLPPYILTKLRAKDFR